MEYDDDDTSVYLGKNHGFGPIPKKRQKLEDNVSICFFFIIMVHTQSAKGGSYFHFPAQILTKSHSPSGYFIASSPINPSLNARNLIFLANRQFPAPILPPSGPFLNPH